MIKTLKGKISLIYLCLVLLTAIVGFASVLNLYGLSKAIDGLLTHNYKSIDAAFRMNEAIERQDGAILRYISVDREKGMDLFLQNTDEFNKWYNIEDNNITEKGERVHIDNINTYFAQYQRCFSQLQEIRSSQGTEKAVEFYDSTILPVFTNIKYEIEALSRVNEEAMFRGKDQANGNAVYAMYILLGLSMFAVIGGFLTAMFFTNRFLKPISLLTEMVKRVKSGHWKQEMEIRSGDEIGELAREFNSMTLRLQEYEVSAVGKLLTEKNKSLAIVKNISDPLIVLDTQYKIILLNNSFERFFDVTEEQVLNKHLLEVIRDTHVYDYIAGVHEVKEEYSKKTIILSSGGEHYFNVIVATVKDMDEKDTGIIVVFQNVTELKKLEKTRADFIATVSHEFKTPLTSIMMGASLLTNENIGKMNEKQRNIVSTIQEDGNRITNLVNELLELSRIESGKAAFHIQPCSISAIIENSVKPLYHVAEQKEVNLYYVAEESLPKVQADYEKITWVINNLVTNALKYTNAGDEISIRAKVERGNVVVSVKDTGIGIPEEYLNKIFEKFVQVKGYDLEVRGTGLGLSIVKDIIKAHGGEIGCESKLDVGSNFVFTLPLAE